MAAEDLELPPVGIVRVVDAHEVAYLQAAFGEGAVGTQVRLRTPATQVFVAFPDEGLRERSGNLEGNGPGELGAVHQDQGQAVHAGADAIRDGEGHGVVGTVGIADHLLPLDEDLLHLQEVLTGNGDVLAQAEGRLVKLDGHGLVVNDGEGVRHGLVTGGRGEDDGTGIGLVGNHHGYDGLPFPIRLELELTGDEALGLVAHLHGFHQIQVLTEDLDGLLAGRPGLAFAPGFEDRFHHLDILAVGLLAGIQGNGNGTVLGGGGLGGDDLALVQIPGRLGAREFHLGHQVQVGARDLHLAASLVPLVFGLGNNAEVGHAHGLHEAGFEIHACIRGEDDAAVGSLGRQVEGDGSGIGRYGEVHFAHLRQGYVPDHIQMGAFHRDEVAALVNGIGGLDDGRIAHRQVCLGVDVVGDGIGILQFVDIGEDDGTAHGVGRHLHLQFVTGLAFEGHGNGVFAGEDDFLHIVQVFTLESEDVTGKDRGGREGFHFDGFGKGQVGKRAAGNAVLAHDLHGTHFGALQGDLHTDFAGRALLDHLDIGHGDTAGKADFRHLVQVAAHDAQFTAPHHGVRGHRAETDAFPELVGIQLFPATCGQKERKGCG